LKKGNEFLKNKLDIIVKEKNDLTICFEKTKKDFDNHKLICKGESPNITFDKNKILNIQNRIKVLDSILKKCVFHMDKMSSMFPKGKTQRKLTSSQAHTHNMLHMHITHMLTCMTKCTLILIVATKVI